MIKVNDVYEGTTHWLNSSQIKQIISVSGRRHNAAIQLIGESGWIRTRETAEQIAADLNYEQVNHHAD